MTDLERAIRDVVIANRILANEGVVDAYGHVSVRHPLDPTRYLLSRSLAPSLVKRACRSFTSPAPRLPASSSGWVRTASARSSAKPARRAA